MGSEYRPKERFLHYTQHWHNLQHKAIATMMMQFSDNLRLQRASLMTQSDLMMEIARSRSYYSQNQALFALWQYTTGGASRRWPMGVPGRAPDGHTSW